MHCKFLLLIPAGWGNLQSIHQCQLQAAWSLLTTTLLLGYLVCCNALSLPSWDSRESLQRQPYRKVPVSEVMLPLGAKKLHGHRA